MGLFRPLPPLEARTRLKSNLFLLFITVIFRTVFTPYLSIRRGLIWLVDDKLGTSYASNGFWWFEVLLQSVLAWNVAEAAYSIYYPAPAPPPSASQLRSFNPPQRSSPLTRAYPTSTPERSTPSRSSALTTASTSTPSRLQSTPSQPSPLSASTTRDVLNRSQSSTPSRTGLFYDTNSPASPSKVAQTVGSSTPSQSSQPQPTQSSGPGGDFVMVEREEKEWVDNVWKGVRGKGGRKGL